MDISQYLYGVLNLVIMRRILLLMAVLLPLSLFGMNDENEKVVMKIPFMMLYDADYSPIIDSGPIL